LEAVTTKKHIDLLRCRLSFRTCQVLASTERKRKDVLAIPIQNRNRKKEKRFCTCQVLATPATDHQRMPSYDADVIYFVEPGLPPPLPLPVAGVPDDDPDPAPVLPLREAELGSSNPSVGGCSERFKAIDIHSRLDG